MDELASADLLGKARSHDADALAAIAERCYPRVLKYMHYRVGPQVAEDLTGDVFVRVVRSIAGQTGSFTAWLYKIAANVIVDHGRRLRTRREGPLDDHTIETRSDGNDPADVVGRQMDLRHAIEKLTDEQRDLVTLKFIMGLTNAQIGEITGRRPEAIRALQFRALGSLREILGGVKAGYET